MDDKKKAVLFLGGGLLCFALAWGIVRGFAGRWPWGAPTGVAGPSWSVRQSMKASGDAIQAVTEAPQQAGPEKNTPEKWVIYLTGEVARPGILEVSPDSRLYEAVEAAGGLTGKADREGVNLAEKLSDGVHVHIPRIGEVNGTVSTAGTEGQQPAVSGNRLSVSAKIDINRASAKELEALPGIGPALARQIVEDRTANGPYRSPEDLLRVKGIGQAKLDKIKEMILVRP